MDNAVEIRGLCKRRGDFSMEGLDLEIPTGYVVGLIGENGAGKTTLIKCITGANILDSGEIRLFGQPFAEADRSRIGVVFDECKFMQNYDGTHLSKLMSGIFDRWDDRVFRETMSGYGIPMDKRIKEYSRGMRMKVQVAVAMAHSPDLLLMDEPTAGMDPAARDEFLDSIRRYMEDESHTAVISSHITSDLERIADYVVFMHAGRIAISGPKDDILESYGIAKGSASAVAAIDRDHVVSVRRDDYSTSALVRDRSGVAEAYPELVVDPASLEDIMVMMVRGERP